MESLGPENYALLLENYSKYLMASSERSLSFGYMLYKQPYAMIKYSRLEIIDLLDYTELGGVAVYTAANF